MKIKLLSLCIQCKQKREVLEFSPQVNFYHGKMSAGKSTIARLVDYCLGSKDLERTTAVAKELVSVELTATIEGRRVLFERTAEPVGNVQVSWSDDTGAEFSVLAPFDQGENAKPLVGEDVYTFSDLMLHLCGKPPLRVRRSTLDEDSPMIRLSFRDIFWYCYLEQNKLDNSFYRLGPEEPFRKTKSRYAIRYILGYYTEKLEELQGRLTKAINDRAAKLAGAKQMRDFLKEVGYTSEKDVQAAIEDTNRQLATARENQTKAQTIFHAETHFADALRDELRLLSEKLGRDEEALSDLQRRLDEYKALKGELTTARQKLSRTDAATSVLAGVQFECCPQCGTKIKPEAVADPSHCSLCGSTPAAPDERRASQTQVARRDIDSRLGEIEDVLNRTLGAVRKQEQVSSAVKREKRLLDKRFEEELSKYDSAFLAQAREADRQIATLEERLRGLDRFQKLPDAIVRLEKDASQLLADQDQIRNEIQKEQASLVSASSLVQQLEETYLRILLAVGVPGVNKSDRVQINRTTWIPDILEGGEEDQRWNFYTAGSNGKKTLLNVCYALAVHEVAEIHKRPLPTLLIIDHPMKCTSPDVNRDVFVAFYRQLYSMIRGSLKETQVILIDNDYFAPDGKDIQLVERYLTPDQADRPPLISYYRGA